MWDRFYLCLYCWKAAHDYKISPLLAEQEKLAFKQPFYPLLYLNRCNFTIKMPSSFKVNTAEKHNSVFTLCIFSVAFLLSSNIYQLLFRVWNLSFFPRAVMIMLSCWGGNTTTQNFSLQNSVTFQNQHLTFAFNSHHMLGWPNIFHRTLLVWFLYKNIPWGPFRSWQSSSLTIMSNYLGVVFYYHFVKVNSWSAGGKEKVGLGWAAVELRYLANLL